MASYPPVFELSLLNGVNGFEVHGQYIFSNVGQVVAGLGDVNGDGIGDFIIGSWRHRVSGGGQYGAAFIVYGRNVAGVGTFPSDFNLQDINGTNGFQVFGIASGDLLGQSVSSAGDVNGDGINDILIGADSANRQPGQYSGLGSAYVIFGRNTAADGDFATTFNIASLDGTNGFKIPGYVAFSRVGLSVASAGDVNHDGIDDLIIGGGASGTNAGAAYVVFGKDTLTAGAFAASIDLSALDGTNGFTITGASNEFVGRQVSSAGDINGDGYDDLVIGASGRDGEEIGGAYIVFGHAPVATPIVRTAAPGGETLTGAEAADILTGGIGKDTLYGMDGDDALDGGDNNDTLYGGAGADVVRGGDGGDTIYGGDGGDDVDGGTGADKLYGDGGDDIIVGAMGNDYIYGGADNDTISGAEGNDYMDGGTGADAMAGGVGNDVYIVDNIGDTVTELSGEGSDIVRAFISFTLGDNLETLQLQGTADIDGTGNSGANNIQGNAGANLLSGGGGVDTINGNDGDDIIVGGLNNDLLRGGMGADTFRILEESINTSVLETDTIYDFSTAEGDRLDLSFIDANTLIGGDQGFVLVSAFTHAGGEMTMTFSGGQTLIRLDVDGDNAADYQLKVNGDVRLDSGGWLL